MPTLTVEILGPLRVSVDRNLVTPTSPRLRSLLATLAMSAGRPLHIDRLIASSWGTDLPAHPRSSLHTGISRLRAAVGRDWIGTQPMSVVLRTEPDNVDALRFGRLLDRAAVAVDGDTRRALLDEALALWQGAPFEDVRSDMLHEASAPQLVERFLTAMEQRIDFDIADGRHERLVPLLRGLTEAHPLREPLWVRYLTVLRRSGRHSEALERYDIVRRRIAHELGTAPSAELRAVHAELLAATAPGPRRPAPRPAPPRLLPISVTGFVGRDRDLRRLDDIRDGAEHRVPARTTTIATIVGAAGVGKTTLAVHWAQRAAAGYPDGCLYADLCGFGPAADPLAPHEALRQFLNALGVPPARIPVDPADQINLYRGLLSDKRVLVVLDNARDADHVRPLLPGSPGGMVLVTSRDQLTGLVARGAGPVRLEMFSGSEARELLAARLGRARVRAEPEAVSDIVEHCGGLPLALSVAAARAALHPGFRLADLAAGLADVHRRLDLLSDGDPATDLRAVFSFSHRAAAPESARLLRLLSRHRGFEVSVHAAARLDGRRVEDVRASLRELCRLSLLTERTPGRYRLHGLLKAYAAELEGAAGGRTLHTVIRR